MLLRFFVHSTCDVSRSWHLPPEIFHWKHFNRLIHHETMNHTAKSDQGCKSYSNHAISNSYNMGMRDLPEIYAQAQGLWAYILGKSQVHAHVYTTSDTL